MRQINNKIVSHSLSKFAKKFIGMTQKFCVGLLRPDSHQGNPFSSPTNLYKGILGYHVSQNEELSQI